jgi:two-component system nitrogen regulation sensor histidine kinase GlnL
MDINSLILNNLNYSVILFDENLVLKFLNLPAQELTGYSDRFLNGITLGRFFNNNAYIEEKVKNVMQTGEGFIEFEYKFQNKYHNQARYVILEISKITDGDKPHLLISLKDITRFKEMDNNIRSEEKIEDLSRFIAEMAHEIKNPLGGIKASAAYLRKKFGGSKSDGFRGFNGFKEIKELNSSNEFNGSDLNNFLEIIIKESERINNLIEELLALSKKHKTKISAVNINKIINEIIIMVQAEFSAKNIEVIKEFDPSLPKIYASENALIQVFLNLLKNSVDAVNAAKAIEAAKTADAAKAVNYKSVNNLNNANNANYKSAADMKSIRSMKSIKKRGEQAGIAGGKIKIITKIDYTRNNPKFIKIEFIDNGCGISKSDMNNIFVPFFTTKEKGTGLGLAVSQKIMHEHGGFIDISSAKNRGTTVSVYIPI